ncbi:1,4-dihydroxy-2-naphthoyl-CoA synthase, peroxisomal [Gossypium raimondii]|uniref:Uncharacterized protein n=1 Tax=Gossypium raimondii TaxID=29730 RepID=A0A0D2QK02_GOSRA|nr:1,4-dihydroxy-2-naphthoyl-CoA synthase, peroxisomal [Gossypium raimondii]KJB17276.1 hypothetical protein B456_003G096800 [Gossypium raimondii]
MVCDLTIAADNAIFGQTGPKVGSFDAGYGSNIMSRLEVGGNATLIFYGTEEGNEGKIAYVERRRSDFSKFSRRP